VFPGKRDETAAHWIKFCSVRCVVDRQLRFSQW
jgi:hypothetical protein